MTNFIQMAQKAMQMKSRLREMAERAAKEETRASSAGGQVSCVMTGDFALKSLTIDPALAAPGKAQELERLIVEAVRAAHASAAESKAAEARRLMEDLGLPPGMDLPF